MKLNKTVLLIVIFILIFFIQNIKEKNFSISEKKLLTKISNKKEYIIFGGLVYGMNNFQYLLENPKIIMMNPQMNYYHNSVYRFSFQRLMY